MSPETYNRLQNTSKEDFDRFVDWLFSHTLAEVREARGDPEATRAAWLRFFRRGLRADLLLDELMRHLPELFRRAQYAEYDVPRVLAMLKGIDLSEMVDAPGAEDETSA